MDKETLEDHLRNATRRSTARLARGPRVRPGPRPRARAGRRPCRDAAAPPVAGARRRRHGRWRAAAGRGAARRRGRGHLPPRRAADRACPRAAGGAGLAPGWPAGRRGLQPAASRDPGRPRRAAAGGPLPHRCRRPRRAGIGRFRPRSRPSPSWPMFRGDAGRSGARPRAAAAREVRSRWQARVGPVASSPVIAGDLVIAATADGRLCFVDRRTGRLLEKVRAGVRGRVLARRGRRRDPRRHRRRRADRDRAGRRARALPREDRLDGPVVAAGRRRPRGRRHGGCQGAGRACRPGRRRPPALDAQARRRVLVARAGRPRGGGRRGRRLGPRVRPRDGRPPAGRSRSGPRCGRPRRSPATRCTSPASTGPSWPSAPRTACAPGNARSVTRCTRRPASRPAWPHSDCHEGHVHGLDVRHRRGALRGRDARAGAGLAGGRSARACSPPPPTGTSTCSTTAGRSCTASRCPAAPRSPRPRSTANDVFVGGASGASRPGGRAVKAVARPGVARLRGARSLPLRREPPLPAPRQHPRRPSLRRRLRRHLRRRAPARRRAGRWSCRTTSAAACPSRTRRGRRPSARRWASRPGRCRRTRRGPWSCSTRSSPRTAARRASVAIVIDYAHTLAPADGGASERQNVTTIARWASDPAIAARRPLIILTAPGGGRRLRRGLRGRVGRGGGGGSPPRARGPRGVRARAAAALAGGGLGADAGAARRGDRRPFPRADGGHGAAGPRRADAARPGVDPGAQDRPAPAGVRRRPGDPAAQARPVRGGRPRPRGGRAPGDRRHHAPRPVRRRAPGDHPHGPARARARATSPSASRRSAGCCA